MEPIKNKFMDRCRIKWGPNYTFEDYVQLENLLISTLRANDISNPLQIDAIKKACKISVQLDKAIVDNDTKGIKELGNTYATFTKTAQIDTVISSSNKEVISTVAELAEEIERCGGQYKYYDEVNRDIVDKTIDDIKKYIRTLVLDSTNLTSTFETIAANYNKKVEQDAAEDSANNFSIEDIIENQKEGANNELDLELGKETLEDIDIEDDDDDIFG